VDRSNQATRFLPRWSLLALSALVPFLALSFILLSASMVAAEPSSPAANVSGTVVKPDGSPITTTTWVCLERYHPTEGYQEWEDCVDTAPDGAFVFTQTIPPELLPGQFVLWAEAPWDSPFYDALPVDVGIIDNLTPVPLGDIPLTYPSFWGMVYEPDGTTLAQWGWVEVLDWEMNGVAYGEYDDTGWYEVGAVPSGELMLVAHPHEDSLLASSAPMSVSVLPGSQYDPDATQYIDLFLQEPNVYGWVVYPDGSPATWIMSGTGTLFWEAIGYAEVKAVNADWTVDVGRPTISSGEFGINLPPDSYEMWAEPEGDMAMGHTRSIPRHVDINSSDPLFETGPMTLTYPSFAGEVFDPGGNPIPACVSVWLDDVMKNRVLDYWYCPEGLADQRTPQQEAPYKLGGIPGGDYWLGTDGLPEFGLLPSEPIFVHVPPGSQYDPDVTQWFDLWLEPAAGPLIVDVVDPLGDPIEARVKLMDPWGSEVGYQVSAPDFPAEFYGLEPGDYRAQAWPMEYDIPELANSEDLWVYVDMEPLSITLGLRYPDVIGTVETPEGDPLPPAFDDEGNPVPHPAMVHVNNLDWSVDIEAMTNISGQFALALPPGEYELVAMPMWSLYMSYTKSLLVEFPIPDPAGASPPLDLGFIPLTYPRVRGWVVDPFGSRVSTGVDIWNARGTYWDWDDTIVGDAWSPDKPFRFGGLPTGHYYVQAQPPWENPGGFGPSNVVDFFVPPHTTQEILLELSIANVIGDLRFPMDFGYCPQCPVTDAEVKLFDATWGYVDETWTGGDGRFAFSGLDPGHYIIEFFLPDEMLMEWSSPPPLHFDLTASDAQVDVGTTYLEPAPRNKHVVGHVVYPDGSPVGDADGDGVGDALVYAYPDGFGYWLGVPTQPDGAYRLDLREGRWWMGVEPTHPDVDWFFLPDWERVVEFPDDPTLEMTKTLVFTVAEGEFFKVSGQVIAPDDLPIVPGTVKAKLCNNEGQCFGNPVETNGDFTLWALPGGYQFRIWVDPDSGLLPPLRNDFSLHVDGDVNLGKFWLRTPADRTAQVSGRVIISSTGQGLSGVLMEAWTDEGDFNHTWTITGGNYVLDLSPGHWHGGPLLTPAQEEQYVILPPRHRDGYLESGETINNVNFRLVRRNATIQGEVVNISGTEIITGINAIVFAKACLPNLPCEVLAEDQVRGGGFELRVVGGLTYTLGIWLPEGGYMPGPRVDVFVNAGGTAHAQVRVIEAGTRIWGSLQSNDPGNPSPQIKAAIFGSAPIYDSDLEDDEYWVEDRLWPGKDPYQYNLYVPTPSSERITWTLKLWVDPSTGYIADPAYPKYEIGIDPNRELVPSTMFVMKLDTIIEGNVGLAGGTTFIPASYVWVFAEGVEGTDAEGLYFEAQSDENGAFSMYVLPGEYVVSAHMPPELMGDFFPPLPVEWASVFDNPVELRFRPRPTGDAALEISGELDVSLSGTLDPGIDDDAPITVFGWSPVGVDQLVTGTLASGYSLPVISHTTWFVWAAYEDLDNGAFYHSQLKKVNVGTSDVELDLTLTKSPYALPGTECWSFDPSKNKRLYLPAREDLFEPIVDIPAGTMPVTGTVKICATPKIALPYGNRLVGFAYEMEAWDSDGDPITENFNGTVRLQFYFNEAALDGADPEELIVAYYSTVRQEWVELENPYIDLDDMFATGKIGHFTQMGVLSAPPTGDYYIYLPIVVKNFGS
jgi:hypothetical protein